MGKGTSWCVRERLVNYKIAIQIVLKDKNCARFSYFFVTVVLFTLAPLDAVVLRCMFNQNKPV